MPKTFDINDEEIKRLVLRGLVAYGYSQISGIFKSANRNMNQKELSFEISEINNEITEKFLSKDQSVYFSSESVGWQNCISSRDLFSLFVFQSLIVNKVMQGNGSATQDKFFMAINKVSKLENVIPSKITLEDEISFPSRGTAKRDFIDGNKQRGDVLSKMLLERTPTAYNGQQIEEIKEYVEKTFCFGKYSGVVAETFFKERTQEVSEIMSQLNKTNIVDGLNLDNQIGVTEDGQPIYESANGNYVGTLTQQVYKGDIYEADKEDPDKRYFVCSTKEYLSEKDNQKENNFIVNEEDDQLYFPLE